MSVCLLCDAGCLGCFLFVSLVSLLLFVSPLRPSDCCVSLVFVLLVCCVCVCLCDLFLLCCFVCFVFAVCVCLFLLRSLCLFVRSVLLFLLCVAAVVLYACFVVLFSRGRLVRRCFVRWIRRAAVCVVCFVVMFRLCSSFLLFVCVFCC